MCIVSTVAESWCVAEGGIAQVSQFDLISPFPFFFYDLLNCNDRLKTFTTTGGRIRLSEDDGPPSREFLEDDFDEDNEPLGNDPDSYGEPLAEHVRNPARAWREPRPAESMQTPGWYCYRLAGAQSMFYFASLYLYYLCRRYYSLNHLCLCILTIADYLSCSRFYKQAFIFDFIQININVIST